VQDSKNSHNTGETQEYSRSSLWHRSKKQCRQEPLAYFLGDMHRNDRSHGLLCGKERLVHVTALVGEIFGYSTDDAMLRVFKRLKRWVEHNDPTAKFGIQNEVYYHLLDCSYSILYTHCQGCPTPLRSMWCTPSF